MNDRSPGPVPVRRAEAGFSLVEALIAAALLLFILIGVLPLFQRSRLNLMQGNDATNITNASVDTNERLLSLPFNSGDSFIAGANSQRVLTDFWLLNGNQWVPDMTVYPADTAQYTRTTTIEQFSVADLRDNGVLDTPLTGDEAAADPGQITLKRFQTDLVGARTAGGGAGVTYHVVTLQSF
jgi:Tfp pilus assembly protein PilV